MDFSLACREGCVFQDRARLHVDDVSVGEQITLRSRAKPGLNVGARNLAALGHCQSYYGTKDFEDISEEII
jgi:hypothetical protein